MAKFRRVKEVDVLISKLGNHKIKIIAGLRRCGKTYLLEVLFKEALLDKKIISNNEFEMIYLAGEHRQYVSASSFGDLLIDCATKGKKVICIDEVQEAENYIRILKNFLHDYPNIDLYITGSNSNTLSQDIIESFKETGDAIIIWPLLYKEIIEEISDYSLNDYLMYGGIPYIVNLNDNQKRREELKSIFENVYYLDILDRVRKENFNFVSNKNMDDIIDNLFDGTTPFSSNAMLKHISKGLQLGNKEKAYIKKEIEDFISIIEKSFLFISCENVPQDKKTPLEKLGFNKKYFCSDCGLAHYKCKVANHKFPLSLETAVFLYLKNNNEDLHGLVFIGDGNIIINEIDFYYQNNYIQVAYTLNSNNYDREVSGLLSLGNESKKYIVCVQNLLDSINEDVDLVYASDFLTK